MQTTKQPPNFLSLQQTGGGEQGTGPTNGNKPAEQAKQLMLTEISQAEPSQMKWKERQKQDQCCRATLQRHLPSFKTQVCVHV